MCKALIGRVYSYSFKGCPWLLLMVIAKHRETGNCTRLNSKGKVELFGIRGIRGMMISWPAWMPWEIFASMLLAESLVITHLVPLVTLGGCSERKIIIGVPTFNESKRGGKPETSKSLKTQLETWQPGDSPGTESNDLYWMHSPGSCSTRVVLMARVVLLRGAKIQCSDNHVMLVKLDSKS